MIDFHYWPTPNGWKVSIMLEECGLPYRVAPVNIGKGDQFKPEFLAISPNNRMPAIVDSDGPGGQPIALFESGAILLYLAEKTGRFLSKDPRKRYDAIQWLMFQMGGVGPMFGQAGHFTRYAPEKIPYAIERYTNESRRLCGVLDKQLATHAFVASEYSIADMAIFPWVHAIQERLDLAEMPHLVRWLAALRARPAVQRGLDVMKDIRRPAEMSEEARSILFGAKQFERR